MGNRKLNWLSKFKWRYSNRIKHFTKFLEPKTHFEFQEENMSSIEAKDDDEVKSNIKEMERVDSLGCQK